MSKIATATLIVLCLGTATGCWLIYGIEYQRQQRELREIQARDVAALESEMYQAWHYATRYETFKDPLETHLRKTITNAEGLEKSYSLIHSEVVWIKSFQRSDVKFAGKSQKYGNGSYQVTIPIMWRTSMEMPYLTAQCRLEKLDGPGDWIASDWKFSTIEYNAHSAWVGPVFPALFRGFPSEVVKVTLP